MCGYVALFFGVVAIIGISLAIYIGYKVNKELDDED